MRVYPSIVNGRLVLDLAFGEGKSFVTDTGERLILSGADAREVKAVLDLAFNGLEGGD